MLQANPGLKMILSAGDDPAFGALTVVNGAGISSPTDFFIGGCDGTAEALADIAKGGVFQATSDFLFPFSATQLERDAEKFFRGQGKSLLPTRIMKPITVTPRISSTSARSRRIRLHPTCSTSTRQTSSGATTT